MTPGCPGACCCSSKDGSFSLSLVELPEVPISPFLQPGVVPVDSGQTLWNSSHSSQLGVLYSPAAGTLCSILEIIKEGVEQGPLLIHGTPTTQWPVTQFCATDRPPLGLDIQVRQG